MSRRVEARWPLVSEPHSSQAVCVRALVGSIVLSSCDKLLHALLLVDTCRCVKASVRKQGFDI